MFKRILSIILCLLLLTSAAFAADGMRLSAEHVESEAFSGDTSLTTVTIDETVAYIDALAFHDCAGLETVYCFSDDVIIADTAFDGTADVTVYCNVMSSMDIYAQSKGFTVKYLNAFEVECDTPDEAACVCLPITWSVINPMPGRDIESSFIYAIYREGVTTPVCTTTTKALSVTYTPTVGGIYYLEITMQNALTTTTLTTDRLSVGSKLFMGSWNGQQIEWRILTVSGDKALVLSEKVLHQASYFNPEWIKYKYTYWSGSNIGAEKVNYKGSVEAKPSTQYKQTITHTHVPLKKDESLWGSEADLFYVHARYWCNNTFYNSAFSDAEKSRIVTVSNSNPDSDFWYTLNGEKKHFIVDCGPSTTDKVFFLSYGEATTYLPDAADKKTTAISSSLTGNWWLRTNGAYRTNAMYVTERGTISMYGTDVGHTSGYRPAMWIKVGS